MLRAVIFFIKLAIVVAVAVWLSNWHAAVAFDLPAYDIDLNFDLYVVQLNLGKVAWPGYRVDTSLGVLVLAVLLFAALVAALYRGWSGLRRSPHDIGRWLQSGRQKRGYRALTQGMVAVAAGEAAEAQRFARKAGQLLDEPPLTLLLAAQAAQLDGDDQAAKRYFTAMLGRDETRFLGLRGLITQALREGDEETALEHVRAAHALRPRTPWVLSTLFDLSERSGDLAGAERAVREAGRGKVLPAPEVKRKQGLILLERARQSQRGPDRAQTIKLARRAHKEAPDLIPATGLYAELLVGSGRPGEAARMLEKSWAAAPHPDLVTAYRAARPGKTGIDWLTQLGKLVAGAPRHPESLLALAQAALEAKLWGEARRYLGEAAEAGQSERGCRLMAELEEAEHDDVVGAREWLLRSAESVPDPAWVCSACGAVAGEWSPRCGACQEYDGLSWRPPPHVAPATLLRGGAGPTAEILAPAPSPVVTVAEDPALAPSHADADAELPRAVAS